MRNFFIRSISGLAGFLLVLIPFQIYAQQNNPQSQVEPAYRRLPLPFITGTSVSPNEHAEVAFKAPDQTETPANLISINTHLLTDEKVKQFLATHPGKNQSGSIQPMTSIVYNPAQIRAAYQLPTLASANPTGPGWGWGQTIFIVDAYNHPKVFNDLTSFSQTYGLPLCNKVNLATNTFVLPAQHSGQCDFSVVYATSTGALTSVAPSYSGVWAQEIALDTQWAHAMAPLARIVLIEAASSSFSNLLGAVMAANNYGHGVVSMSWSAGEGSYVNSTNYTSIFPAANNMAYFAATGDNGSAANWPAVEPTVIGVSGTSLNSYTVTTRNESVWSGTGGGISKYVKAPTYQTALVIPGLNTTTSNNRSVSDVAMDANPNTGVAVAFTSLNASSPTYYVFGGTSLSTPLWASMIALSNEARILQNPSNTTFSAPHALLYYHSGPTLDGNTGTDGNWGSNFLDITSGANGSCSTCSASSSYDAPSGLGSPNGVQLINYMAGK